MTTETTTRRLQLADGHVLQLELKSHGVHVLKAARTAAVMDSYLHEFACCITGDDLRRLCSLPGPESCGNCRFARVDRDNATRCHRTTPRKKGDETFFLRVQPDSWCAKYRAHAPVPPPRTEAREVAA